MSAPRNIQIVWTRAARIRHALNQDLMVDKWDGEKELRNSWKWSCSFWVQIDFFRSFRAHQSVLKYLKMFHLKSEVFSKENYKKWLDVVFENIFPISTLKPPIFLAWNSTKFRFFDETFHSHLCKMRHFGKFSNPFFFIEIDCSFVSCTSFCMSSSCKIGIWPMYGIFFLQQWSLLV